MKFLLLTCVGIFAENSDRHEVTQKYAVKPLSCDNVPHFAFSYNSTCDERETMTEGSLCETVCAEKIISECSCMIVVGFIYQAREDGCIWTHSADCEQNVRIKI
jgi:hypothetical protein